MSQTKKNIQQDIFCDVKKLSEMTCLCPNTLKTHMKDLVHPLPHYKLGGKLLVKWSEFCGWMERFKVSGGRDLNRMVDEIVGDCLNTKRLIANDSQ